MIDLLKLLNNSKMKKKKTKWHRHCDIVQGISPITRLMVKANLSYISFRAYLKYMEEKGLIKLIKQSQRSLVVITTLGKQILWKFEKIKRLLDIN